MKIAKIKITGSSRRQQKRKISYQPLASFIPHFVDDSEEIIGSPIADATYQSLVFGSRLI